MGVIKYTPKWGVVPRGYLTGLVRTGKTPKIGVRKVVVFSVKIAYFCIFYFRF